MKPPHGNKPSRGPFNGPPRPASGSEQRGGEQRGGERQLRLDRPRDDRAQPDRASGPNRGAPNPAGPNIGGQAPGRAHSGDQRGQHARPSHAAAPRPGPDAPRGTVWLYGTHAVMSALANPARRLRRLLLTEDAEPAFLAKLKQPWAVQPERVDRARLDQLLGRDIVHQGAALLADLLAPPMLATVMERPGPILVLDQVTDPRNVGAILRSAAAFGTAAVITQERNAPEETGALAKAASGALETIPLLRAVNIARTLIALKAAGCWVVGLDASGPALSGPSLAERRVALVLGSEGEGMRRLTRDTCDEIAGIAMPRMMEMESLNVSAAAAIALYEMSRRG
jgi:23S rRNA (guanosine2251-2'-O)-methyltransferase